LIYKKDKKVQKKTSDLKFLKFYGKSYIQLVFWIWINLP